MTTGLTKAARYRAVLERDRRYDGIFYFATKSTGIYCRTSCSNSHPSQKDCFFFDTLAEAKLHGYRACKRCHPDKLQNDLSLKILRRINKGEINDKGVHGLAESLHISDRHLRRIVHDRTGTSPVRLNQAKRLTAARQLVAETDLLITEIAFSAGFSSLRQFNDAFKGAYKTSPRKMRKTASHVPRNKPADSIVLSQGLAYKGLLRVPLRSLINY
jgi:AraC family transcriptional regulator, regulatory protein of adaptative response / DNA-3-methyladenine glycosylase II